MISGRCCPVARSMSRVSRSPTTDPMLPMMKAESVTPKATRRARIMPVPVKTRRRRSPVRCCSATSRSRYGLPVGELQRIGRLQVGVPFLERALVQHLANPLVRRHVPMVVAFRADAEPLLRILAEDGVLAARTTLPEPLGHAALGTLGVLLARHSRPPCRLPWYRSHSVANRCVRPHRDDLPTLAGRCLPQIAQRIVPEDIAYDARQRLGHDQPNHAVLVLLQQSR